MSPEIFFFIPYPEFIPDIPSVGINRFSGQVEKIRYFFGGFALPYKI